MPKKQYQERKDLQSVKRRGSIKLWETQKSKKEGISQCPATNPKKVGLCNQQEQTEQRLALTAQKEAYQDAQSV